MPINQSSHWRLKILDGFRNLKKIHAEMNSDRRRREYRAYLRPAD